MPAYLLGHAGGLMLEIRRAALRFRFVALLVAAHAAAAAFGVRRLSADEAADLAHGRRLAPDPDGPAGTEAAPVAAVAPDGTLVALVRDERGATRPVLVLAPA